MLSTPIRVLIADNHHRSRKGLRALLATSSAIDIIGEAANGQEAVHLAAQCRPDVILMDARMPVMNGLEATRQIKGHWPRVKILMLTISGADRIEASKVGADGFFVKGDPIDVLLTAILNTDF